MGFTLLILGLYSLVCLCLCEGVGIWCIYGFFGMRFEREKGRYVLYFLGWNGITLVVTVELGIWESKNFLKCGNGIVSGKGGG